MKTKIFLKFGITLLYFFLLVSFIILREEKNTSFAADSPPVDNPVEKFLVTATHTGFDNTTNAYSRITDTLKFNGWHKYNDWFANDTYDNPDSGYINSNVRARVSTNNSKNLRTVFGRPIIDYTAYGQRSDYQCEVKNSTDSFWFYSYNTSINNQSLGIYDVIDSNSMVKYCRTNPGNLGSNAGYIVKDLKANREQANKQWPPLVSDYSGAWYVKPRIRIPTGLPDSTQVCKIIVLDWNGNTIKNVEITAAKFKNLSNPYNGQYLDKFYFSLNPNDPSSPIILLPGEICPGAAKNFSDWRSTDSTNTIKTDFRVYWYGQCDMWIDYIRVENEQAKNLFESPILTGRIASEVHSAMLDYDPSRPNNFYQEEFEFNTNPCRKRVNEIIDSVSGGRISLMVNLNVELYNAVVPFYNQHLFTADEIKEYLIDYSNIKILIPTTYCLEGGEGIHYPTDPGSRSSLSPNTLPVYSHYSPSPDYDWTKGLLCYKASPSLYDDWLQHNFDNISSYNFKFTDIMKLCDLVTKNTNVKLIDLQQSHMWFQGSYRLKEPTNEELEVTCNLAITYGVKGILYFAYNGICTGNGYNTNYDTSGHGGLYTTGFIDLNKNVRDINAYGQNKWSFYKRYDRLIEKWEPYIMSFDNSNRASYIVRSEINNLKDGTYFNDILSYKPDPAVITNPLSTAESESQRYLQVAKFNNPNAANTNYFMIVNRRCSPIDTNNPGGENGRRFIKIKLDSNSSYFSGFNNWSIFDLEKDSLIKTFNKNSIATIDLGWYLPGEGKLYKIAPVMQEGGTLVADEECSGTFDCKGEVNNNGKNISLKPGTTINFANDSARIKMDHGSFKSGYSLNDNTASVYLTTEGNFWKGLLLNGCDTVKMIHTYFRNIAPYPADSTYAADLINCRIIDIQSSNFLSELSIKTGCIRASYVSNQDAYYSAYLLNNTFEIDAGGVPAVSFISSGGLTFPLIIEGNNFSAYTENSSSNAILLSNVTGGAIKNNNISGFTDGVIMLSSGMDFYKNTIDGTAYNSIGIQGHSQSDIHLSPSGSYYTSGQNQISSEGDISKCIYVDKSSFNIYKGENTFDLKNYNSLDAYHLSGWFPGYPVRNVDAEENCFQTSENNVDAIQNVKWVNGVPVSFTFTPYSCEITAPSEYELISLGNGINDTIYYKGGGNGGGDKDFGIEISNLGFKTNTVGNLKKEVEITSYTGLLDSIGINIRRRNYENVSENCYEFLNSYPDSVESIGLIPRLYLSSLRLDSAGINITDLKTFLETLILNHPGNNALIKQAFYYIQKCKVSLHQYQSAMTGFQQIIEENPYSYEGLVASWDYSATSLLDSAGTSGGGESNYELEDAKEEANSSDEILRAKYLNDDPKEKYDAKSFTKEDRKAIRENIFNSYETSREIEITKVKSLETKVADGHANETEKKDLQTKNTLKEIVKANKPNDILQHIQNINNNIKRVFNLTDNISSEENKNLIPTEFKLAQNYPNPFNPVTKINFELPQSAKVKLIVYDILGREVKTLVNSELLTGRYTFEFDGSNFASGIYFYRLETVNFVQSKRMVLIK